MPRQQGNAGFRPTRRSLLMGALAATAHGKSPPPTQITPGAVIHWLGVPHLSGIAGPTYLMTVSPNGEMDKFDGPLAARQVSYYADVIRRLDSVNAASLRTGDPTLGKDLGSAADRAYRDAALSVPCLGS